MLHIPVIESDPNVISILIKGIQRVQDRLRFRRSQKPIGGKTRTRGRGVGEAECCLDHLEAHLIGQGPAVLTDKCSWWRGNRTKKNKSDQNPPLRPGNAMAMARKMNGKCIFFGSRPLSLLLRGRTTSGVVAVLCMMRGKIQIIDNGHLVFRLNCDINLS